MRALSVPISFVLNGRPVTHHTEPGRRVADLLRDELGLTGTKIGCNAGDCGACTVLLDDQQVCACLVPAARLAGARLTTVEGLAGNETLSAVQASFLRHGAAQCGICTPGMLIAATDLLITADTMAAHLAGSIGHKALVAVPSIANFYWGPSGNGTAWYPSLRLFRQAPHADWNAVGRALVKAALA